MQDEFVDGDIARNSAPSNRDTARHQLTIDDTVKLFTSLGTPRSKRSVQRFCKEGHIDAVRIPGPRGDQFFINRESVEHYSDELRQIEAIAAIGDEPRYDAPQHAIARNSAPERATPTQASVPTPIIHEMNDSETEQRLQDENLNLRIDNRAKESAIVELNRRLTEDRDTYVSALTDMSYKLGAAETRLAQLKTPKKDDDTVRQSAPTPETIPIAVAVMPEPEPIESTPAAATEHQPTVPQRSFWGRLFR